MFGQVVFLLYCTAICFSYALFPNVDDETQRRPNPGENMANTSSSQEDDSCMERLRPCVHNLRHFLALQGPHQIVVDGRIAVPCGSNLLEESRNCIDSVSRCRNHHYDQMKTAQALWDFICQNSQAFVSGDVCWRSTNLTQTIRSCFSFYTQLIICGPECLQLMVEGLPDCSAEDAILLGQLAARQKPC